MSEYESEDQRSNQSTPPFHPIYPKLTHEDSPPPYVSAESAISDIDLSDPDDSGRAGEIRDLPRKKQQQQKKKKKKKKKEKEKQEKRRQSRPRYGLRVLLTATVPDRPYFAQELADNDRLSDFEDESEDHSMSDGELEEHQTPDVASEKAVTRQDVGGQVRELLPLQPMDVDEDFEDIEQSPPAKVEPASLSEMPGGNDVSSFPFQADNGASGASNSEFIPPRTPLDVKPPPWSPSDSKALQRVPLAVDTSRGRLGDHESLLESPALAKFTISSSAEGIAESTLPAMQLSPPGSSLVHSPDNAQRLPPLHAALSLDSAASPSRFPILGQSPGVSRPSPGNLSQFGPPTSSYGHPSPGMSPPNIPPHPGFYRGVHREGSTTDPSEYSLSTPSSIPTPATASSTASHAPTAAAVSERGFQLLKAQSRKSSIEALISAHASTLHTTERSPRKRASFGQVNGVHPTARQGSQASPTSDTSPITQPLPQGPQQPQSILPNAFKCTYPGCTSAPFGTQYLLNSHANVHSSSRPHFCQVRGCNRGPGGKGFKRKNEMIRHGLVHSSPGYVCPFCPDQQHKYPRPDNLQRHVRVHHVDKDRDDPLLREVLAQRPDGMGTGHGTGGGAAGRGGSRKTRLRVLSGGGGGTNRKSGVDAIMSQSHSPTREREREMNMATGDVRNGIPPRPVFPLDS